MSRFLLLFSLVVSLCALDAMGAAPDLILWNGKVFTSDPANPNAGFRYNKPPKPEAPRVKSL